MTCDIKQTNKYSVVPATSLYIINRGEMKSGYTNKIKATGNLTYAALYTAERLAAH